jgi:hypothetical protein
MAADEDVVRAATRRRRSPDPLGSHVVVERTTRPVKQYAILDTDLANLSGNGTLTTLLFGLSTLAFGFAGSCWLLRLERTLDAVTAARVETAEAAGIAGGVVFFALTLVFVVREQTLIRRIRKTSVEISL